MKNKKISLVAGIALCTLTVLFTVLYIALFGEEVAAEKPVPADASDSYAEDAILFACEKGYLTCETVGGVPYVYPQKEVTRGEIAAVLTAFLSLPAKDYKSVTLGFADEKLLPEEQAPAIKAALALQYMKLNADYTFGAEKGISREEVADIFAALIDKEISAGKSERFSDFHTVSAHFEKGAKKLADLEIMIGYEDGTFRPKNILTREELALLLYRLFLSGYSK